FVKRLPLTGQEVVVEKIDRVPGGKGGNVSVAASRILGPGHVALLACVGRDDVGNKQIAILKLEGVDTSAVQSLDRLESGQAYITVDEKGSNVIETHFGANAGLKREHLMLPPVQSILASSRMLVVIDPPRHVAGKLLAEGRRLGRSVMWHPGVLTRFGLDEFEDDMEDLEYLVLNEHEASLFAEVKGLDASLAKLAEVSPKARILVTLGSRGAAFYLAGKLSKIPRVSLEKLGRKVVNTRVHSDQCDSNHKMNSTDVQLTADGYLVCHQTERQSVRDVSIPASEDERVRSNLETVCALPDWRTVGVRDTRIR